MAFKEPNLVYSDDPDVAAAATRLLMRRNHGTTTSNSDCKVLWMGAECALVKRNPFFYNGENYSGDVEACDIEGGGNIVSSGLGRRVHICGHLGFCDSNYSGTYGRLTAAILTDLIEQAPQVYAELVAEHEQSQREQRGRWQREADEREAREARVKEGTRLRDRDRLVTSRMEILWNFAIHWPAKYRHAIEACLDTDTEFDRASIHRSVE